MSEWIETHQPCPCGSSSDAFATNSDGWGKCFSCDKRFPPDGYEQTERKDKVSSGVVYNGDYQDKPKRGLYKETLQRFGYKIGEHNGDQVEFAPFYDEAGLLVGTKVRGPNKKFYATGEVSTHLFGRKLWSSGGKRLVITEGEIDALSYAQASDLNWPVVSVPSGVGSAVKAVKANLEYIESFKEVVILFDNDEPGEKAAHDVAMILRPGKAKIGRIPAPYKDASDMLVAGEVHQLLKTVWNAEVYRPDGIVDTADLWELVSKPLTMGAAYPWACLNRTLYGMRPKEIVTLTAGTGIGKSTICAEIAYDLLMKGETIGYVALEEGVDRTALRFMALDLNKPIHLPGHEVEPAALEAAFKRTCGSHRLLAYDHFGSVASGQLLAKLRYMVVGLGCRYLFLDHLSIVVSSMEFDDGLDERKELDKMMTQLRSFTEETGASLIVVSHLKRKNGQSHEDGGTISLADLRGSQAIAQLSDAVIGVERNQQDEEASNRMCLRVLKNRYSGWTGRAGCLVYDDKTGRISETEDFDDASSTEANDDF